MEIKGKIIAVMVKRSGQSQRSGNTWASQDYVVETQDQYPKKCLFNVFGEDKIAEYALKVGDDVTVSFDIDAREYNGRWYNDVRAWRVQPQQSQAQPPMHDMPPFMEEPQPAYSAGAGVVDDMPF